LHKEQHSQQQIAANLSIHPATTARDLYHNPGGRGYRPKPADELAQARKQPRSKPRITPQTWALVESALR
jgi:IS30 family transposase